MRYDDDTWAAAEALKAEGCSDAEISQATGIPRSTIYNHFARASGTSRMPSRAGTARPSQIPDSSVAGGLIGALAFLGLMIAGWRSTRRVITPGSQKPRVIVRAGPPFAPRVISLQEISRALDETTRRPHQQEGIACS